MTILTKKFQLHFDKLCTVYPLLKTINTKMVDLNDSLVESLIKTHQTFFTEVNYPQERNGLNNKLQAELAKPIFKELKTQIKYFVKKYFNPQPAIDSLETIIPDILLILLAKYPIENNKQTIPDLICGACEAQSFQGWFDNEEHLKYLYLIEWQAPGLLSRAPDRSTANLISIHDEIKKVTATNPQFTPADIELTVGRNLKFPEGRGYVRRSTLHPVSRFLAQDIPHQNFANTFPYLIDESWPLKRLEELNAIYQKFFRYHLINFPTDIDADAMLRIVDRYKLFSGMAGLPNPMQLKEQCSKIIAVDKLIKRGADIKRPDDTPDNDLWEKRKLTCYHKYFLLLFQNSTEHLAPEKTIGNIDEFENFLALRREQENYVQTIKRCLKRLFPHMVDSLDNEKIKTLKKIQEKLLKPVWMPEDFKALASTNKIDFDMVMGIILDNNLIDFLNESNTEADIIRQCRKILSVAGQINTDAKNEKHKPAMMQIEMQLPGGYKHFKINPLNLEEALYLIENRGSKSQDELIRELGTVGKNNYQRPKTPNPEPSKENPPPNTNATLTETKTLSVQLPPVVTPASVAGVINPSVTTQTVAQTIKPQTFAPAIAVQLTTAGMDTQNSFSVLSTIQAKQEVLLKAISDWESRAQQDAAEKAELEEIAKEPEVKAYYHMLKAVLGQSFMAATVIASGKVEGNSGIGVKATSGLSSLSTAASAASVAAFPFAAPILGFFKFASSTLSSTLTYRDMQKHVKWVELEEIPQFAATLARRLALALAQKRSIPSGISRKDETTWSRIKNECGLLIEQLKSGVAFSVGEKRALLDAELLFEYILSHERPLDMTLSGRINVLLQHLVGSQSTHVSSMHTNSSAIIAPTTNTHASQDEIKILHQTVSAQGQQLQILSTTVNSLHKAQELKNQTNNNVDAGDGQMLLTRQIQDEHFSQSGPAALLAYLYKRVTEQENAIAYLGVQTAIAGEKIATLEQEAQGKNTQNKVKDTQDDGYDLDLISFRFK